MNKAFIFDMDGVLVDSETAWAKFEMPMLQRLFGGKTAEAVGDTTGLGLMRIYEKAHAADPSISMEDLERGYDSIVEDVYANAPITPGTVRLASFLLQTGFRLGLVTQSQQSWIDRVVPRLSFKDKLETIISLYEHPDLRPKPAPDGYVEALRLLDAEPSRSFVLEDTNLGIAAGKGAGACTIGFRGNLPDDYVQEGADAYADTMDDVIQLTRNRREQD